MRRMGREESKTERTTEAQKPSLTPRTRTTALQVTSWNDYVHKPLNLDQYEVHRKDAQSVMPNAQQPQYNVLLSNPLHSLTNYFQMQPVVSAPNPVLVSVQPTAMPHHQQPTTSVSSPIMPNRHPPIQHHHTHPKLAIRESPEPPARQRTESHHQMSRSSPQRQLSPKVSFISRNIA
jgi:hypothetical protein